MPPLPEGEGWGEGEGRFDCRKSAKLSSSVPGEGVPRLDCLGGEVASVAGLFDFGSSKAGALRPGGSEPPCCLCKFHVALMIFFCSSINLSFWPACPPCPPPPALSSPSRKTSSNGRTSAKNKSPEVRLSLPSGPRSSAHKNQAKSWSGWMPRSSRRNTYWKERFSLAGTA